jgi:hypothetical protein
MTQTKPQTLAPPTALVVAALACVPQPAQTTSEPPAETTAETTSEPPTGTTDVQTDQGGEVAPLVIDQVEPALVDPDGGSQLVVRGAGFAPGMVVRIGGVEVTTFELVDAGELRLTSPPVTDVGSAALELERGSETAQSPLEVWSPTAIAGARVFDAAHGVTTGAAEVTYEWQRLTANIGDDWRVRDGNTLSWLPSRGRFIMVAGWNGEQAPEGFSTVGPDVYPPENTSDEVWSSADGVSWTLDLPHGHGQFERRHAHNTMLWNDRLWMIGGDHHQGYYNHDVVSSADGLDWQVELGPGTTPPPWSERAAQVSGVYAGKLWTVGGQDLIGEVELQAYHNDVWSSEDGVNWEQVVADAPASATRWAGCGVLDGLVEFQGRMWLVGCARYRDSAEGHLMSNEVWSTTDGAVWTRHADPPWQGKIWPNVVVWRGELWILFGYTHGDPMLGLPAGNANEVWHSADGETWEALPFDAPVPGSHAQGVAVHDDFLLYAGGNYSFGFGAGLDKSAWRLVPVAGDAVTEWRDHGGLELRVRPPVDAAGPLRVADAFGPGRPGLHFDGSTALLRLEDAEGAEIADPASSGLSVFWVARSPYSPPPYGWTENYNPASTVVGGTYPPSASAGFTDGALSYVNLGAQLDENNGPIWDVVHVGAGLQEGPGSLHTVGFVHEPDGVLTAFIDGAATDAGSTDFGEARAWSRIGGGIEGPGEGPINRFAGTLGAVVVVPNIIDPADAMRLHAWARGRFGAP